MYLNDGFKNALDVLVKKRMDDRSEGMNEGFIEIEEQKQVLQKLENEQKATEMAGKQFLKMGELMAAKKKLMMMEKRIIMDKQMMMFKQKQMMMAKQRMMQEQKQKMMMLGQLNTKQKMLTNTSMVTPMNNIDIVRNRNLKYKNINPNNAGLRGDCLVPLVCAVQCYLWAWVPPEVQDNIPGGFRRGKALS